MKAQHQRLVLPLSAVALLGVFTIAASGESRDALLRRYPYDPACPWGRLSNGRGLLVRCISEAESQGLVKTMPPAAPAAVAESPSSAGSSEAAGATAPGMPDEAGEADAGGPTQDEKLEVSVGPVSADSGQLGVGKLGVPKDRYVKCVNDNGGLRDKTGEVHVRFLVRQRGRAEGVSVAKRVNVSTEAARCVAEVVDRRYVGVPDAPLLGATVQIKFSKAPH